MQVLLVKHAYSPLCGEYASPVVRNRVTQFYITIDIFALISLHFIYRVAYYCLTYTYVKVEG